MKKSRKNKYVAFFNRRVALWRNDIALFAWDNFRFVPDEWQAEGFKKVQRSKRVSIKSGQGVGKTAWSAIVFLWFLTCFANARVVATAPTRQQLNDVLWAELEKWRQKSPLLVHILKWTKTYIYFVGREKRWFGVARASSKPENMQGFHEDNMLFIIDEASGVDEAVLEAIRGTLTGSNNKLIFVGNPTQTSGMFYDSHNSERASWDTMTVDAEKSKRTDKENIAALKKKYGADSNVVRVRVHGLFPLAEDDVFGTDLQFFLQPFETLEEYQVDGAGPVGEPGNQPDAPPLPRFFDAGDAAAQLDPGCRSVDFAHAVKTGAVDIAEGKGVQQVPERTDPQLFVEQFRPLWPYAGQILDIAVQNLRHTQI